MPLPLPQRDCRRIYLTSNLQMYSIGESKGKEGKEVEGAREAKEVKKRRGKGSGKVREEKENKLEVRRATILYSLDSTLNPHRILKGWAHLDRTHIIGKRLIRAF